MGTSTLHIGIAGAGIMGRVLAWQLLRAGHAVTLFDRDPVDSGGAAAWTAAGMLAPYTELESAESAVFELGQRSLQLWPDIADSLQAGHCYHTGGSLVVAHRQDTPDLEHFNQILRHKLPDAPGIRFLGGAELAQLEPALAGQFSQATFLAGEAWVHTTQLMAALARAIEGAGGRWHAQAEVTALAADAITCGNVRHGFDRVIDTRGLGARPDLSGLRGVRGEVIEVHAPDVNITRMVRLMHPRYRLYLVPREDHHYLLGATQIESDDMSQISVRSALELLSALYAIQPAFGEARIVATRTNCRPALADNLPQVMEQDGVLQVNGLYRHGYLLAPAMAELAMQALQAGRPTQHDNQRASAQ